MLVTPIKFDFRSDTVTRPNAAMRAAMASAEVGDDVFGDDPTVNRLEAELSDMVGHEAGLFVPSGTQSNLIALMSHCGRGDEYIAGQEAHCYVHEAGGAAVLGSIQPQPLTHQVDGSLALGDIEAAIKPDDAHFATTRLLALENTFNGKVLDLDYMQNATDLARRRGLACHLDGARLFNAAAVGDYEAGQVATLFDTVSICFSKGLGAPAGSVLVGNKAIIEVARRHRKILGGAMRQSGILAAAGLYALANNVERLTQDHDNAAQLAAGLAEHAQLSVHATPTNILFVDVADDIGRDFANHLAAHGVGATGGYGGQSQRWVTHLDISEADVKATLEIVARFFD